MQGETYATAIGELRNGRKTSHWVWYVFPQIMLGRSDFAAHYAIESCCQAVEYLRHPLLGPRYQESVAAVTQHVLAPGRADVDRGLAGVLGGIDATKFVSSLTLFAEVARVKNQDDLRPLVETLDRWYATGMKACGKTLDFIVQSGDWARHC